MTKKKKERLTKAQKKDIEDIIKQGKKNFVLKIGLRFGLIMFAVAFLYSKFIEYSEWDLSDTLINLIIWGIAGLIYGIWSWNNLNKKLNKKI